MSSTPQHGKVKPLLTKPSPELLPIKLPSIDYNIKKEIEDIVEEEDKLKNQEMLLESNISFSQHSMLSVINSTDDSSPQFSVETEEEVVIITDQQQIKQTIKEKFDETKFEMKHLGSIVKDLENRVYSLYENCLYVLLAQQRKWYKDLKPKQYE